MLVRSYTDGGSLLRILAFVVAAIALTALHFVLRQSVREIPPSKPLRFAARRTRPAPDELFASEADGSWTGLTDVPPEPRRERI